MILTRLQCLVGHTTFNAALARAERWSPHECLASLNAAAQGRVPADRYVGTGRQRCFDPLALCLAELCGKDIVDLSEAALVCSAHGAARHYFDVTRILLGGEPGFNPLAYSNRSANAIASQCAQALGLHGGARLLACMPQQPLRMLRHAWQMLQLRPAPPVVHCGGQLPSLDPLTTVVYPHLAGSGDVAVAFAASAAETRPSEAAWRIRWADPAECATSSRLNVEISAKAGAQLLQGDSVIGRFDLGGDPSAMLAAALFVASAGREVWMRDTSGLACCVQFFD